MSMIKGANRIAAYEQPAIWGKFAHLAGLTKATNLGQGFPSWNPPKFFYDSMNQAINEGNHQYTRAYGTPFLTQQICDFYSPYMKTELHPDKNILVSNGGVTCLQTIFQSMLNPGEEVILLDPSYDCYAASIHIAGGVIKSVPLQPKHMQTKADLLAKKDRYQITEKDHWEVDYELLEKSLNSKTKCIIINSPHNPCGHVFSKDDYEKMAAILRKYPQVLIIEDMVYEHLTFDSYKPFELPRMSFINDMADRCVSVSSAGKLFSATGIRVGWCIGPEHIIKHLKGFHQYNIFCQHGPTQNAIGECLRLCQSNGYFEETNQKMIKLRNVLLDGLVEGTQDFHIWIPQGGYFILCDISKLKIKEKYYQDELFPNQKFTNDLAYLFEQSHERKLLSIPCSVFYQPDTKMQGSNLVRFAFCKDEELLLDAKEKLGLNIE